MNFKILNNLKQILLFYICLYLKSIAGYDIMIIKTRMQMEFRALKYFLIAAREGSITKAANRLNLTQPNLSRQISSLERDIGKKRF